MVNLGEIYLGLQKEMTSSLELGNITSHPTSKGDDTEEKWRNWLSEYLPRRYAVDTGFVIDYEGNMSKQIDVIVFDNIYSPPIIKQKGFKYLPAESVYAAFEIKQNMAKKEIRDAMSKIASIRVLKRTNVPFNHATGTSNKEPPEIIGGILTKKCTSSKETIEENLKYDDEKKKLNIGCSMNNGFTVGDGGVINFFDDRYSLVYFLYELLSRLREAGTVAAIDYSEYLKNTSLY